METKVKYPRTPHLPWSKGITNDDKILKDTSVFDGKRVIVTEKMDGECSSLLNDCTYARSLDSVNHYTRNWLKRFHAEQIKGKIPGLRICGENLYAKHSIAYENLKSYFYGFSVWDNNTNTCLSWTDTLLYFEMLEIQHVPILFDGIYNEDVIKSLWNETLSDTKEGYVVRLFDSFHYNEFGTSVAKFVRPNHVQTDAEHWMHKDNIEINKLECKK